MKQILVTWLGDNDIEAARRPGEGARGAIAEFLQVESVDHILLLHNRPEDAAEFVEYLASGTFAEVHPVPVALPVPHDFDAVYDRAREAVLEVLTNDQRFQSARTLYLLSSGTKAMSSALFLIACSDWPGRIYFNWKDEGSHRGPAERLVRVRWPERFSLSLFAGRGPLLAAGGAVLDADGRELSRSPLMREVYARAARVAPTGEPVLILGETGTGKEVLATRIHADSLRTGKLVAINCGAIPPDLVDSELFGHVKGAFTGAHADRPGKIRAADGGTLFLDEIAELPESAQLRLLRVLQEKEVTPVGGTEAVPVDVRIIAATHKPVRRMVLEGKFREDVYFRLAGYTLTLPSLRERAEAGDLELIAGSYLTPPNKEDRPIVIDDSGWRELRNYTWPGNVRELQNVIKRCCIDAEERHENKVITGTLVRGVIRDQGLGAGLVAAGESHPESDPTIIPGIEGYAGRVIARLKKADITLKDAMDRIECGIVRQAVAGEGRDRDAAAVLGLSPQNLANKKKKWRENGLWKEED